MLKRIEDKNNPAIYELVPFAANPTQVPSKIKYYVNEDKGTVVAVMENCEGDFLTYFHNEKRKINSPFSFGYDVRYLHRYHLKNTYRGKASCHPDDKFDLKRGMELARSRMLFTYYHDLLFTGFNWREDFNQIHDAVNNIEDHFSYRLDDLGEFLFQVGTEP